jgi:ADP-ribose pyrophosphatase
VSDERGSDESSGGEGVSDERGSDRLTSGEGVSDERGSDRLTSGEGGSGKGSGALDDPLRERLVGSEVIREGRVLEFRVDEVETADGHRSRREIAAHPGGVAIVAIDPAGRVLLVRQWRHATGQALLEIPAGTLDRDADGRVEDHRLAAARELEEETGSRAGTWRYLGSVFTAPGFTSERMYLYLATDLTPVDEGGLAPDEDERLELRPVPFADAVALAEHGEIIDAKSIVGLLWAADRLHGER